MKRFLPSRLARTASLMLLGFSFIDSPLLAAPDPVLDVTVLAGKAMRDKSKAERTVKARQLSPGSEEQTVLIQPNGSITVPFADEDSLFAQGPWTWMARCKIKQAVTDSDGYSIAGRWEGRDDRRIMMLGLDGKTGRPRLQVSTTGSLADRTSVDLKNQMPENAWVTIVGRFDPGQEMAIQLFDEAGELVDSAARSSKVPDTLAAFPLPLTIGRQVPVEMELSRFRAWDAALADDDIKGAVADK